MSVDNFLVSETSIKKIIVLDLKNRKLKIKFYVREKIQINTKK